MTPPRSFDRNDDRIDSTSRSGGIDTSSRVCTSGIPNLDDHVFSTTFSCLIITDSSTESPLLALFNIKSNPTHLANYIFTVLLRRSGVPIFFLSDSLDAFARFVSSLRVRPAFNIHLAS